MTRTLALAGIAVAVVAVVAAGVLVLPTATAQEATPTPGETENGDDEGTSRREDRQGDRRERFLEFRGDLATDLAAQLDVPAEDVEAAFRAVVAQRLDEAVESGDLDRERADELLAAYDEGAFPGGFGRGGFGRGGFGPGHGHGRGFGGGDRGGPGAWFGGGDS